MPGPRIDRPIAGDADAAEPRDPPAREADALLPDAYRELRTLARSYMRGQPGPHVLQPTALVHEAYLRLARNDKRWSGREHFLAVAARAMRHVLVDHARAVARAPRRGEGMGVTTLSVDVWERKRDVDPLAIHEALGRLGKLDLELEQVVELKIFAGLALPAVARVMKTSLRTAERNWQIARAWLRGELRPS